MHGRSGCSRSGSVEDALAEQVEVGAAVHRPFDELESIDMALDDPITVGQSQAGDNGRLTDESSEPAEKAEKPEKAETPTRSRRQAAPASE